jgi:hypothetical protein
VLPRTCGDKSKHRSVYEKLSSVLINGYKKSDFTVLDGTTVANHRKKAHIL